MPTRDERDGMDPFSFDRVGVHVHIVLKERAVGPCYNLF